MKQIKFINDSKPYNVMVEDERYVICSRIYTVEESKQEAEQWDNDLDSRLKEVWEELSELEKSEWDNDFFRRTFICIYFKFRY